MFDRYGHRALDDIVLFQKLDTRCGRENDKEFLEEVRF